MVDLSITIFVPNKNQSFTRKTKPVSIYCYERKNVTDGEIITFVDSKRVRTLSLSGPDRV